MMYDTRAHSLVGIFFLEPGRPVWECSCISSRRMPLKVDEAVEDSRARAAVSHARHRDAATAWRQLAPVVDA